MSSPRLATSCRIRSTPYTSKIEKLGVSGFSVVNHTILPKGFARSVDEDYWHLKQHVQLWDVTCQRQVELTGPDAARLTQLMTPRDLRNAMIGQCLYAPMVDHQGGMLNDPIILKLADDHFWLSIADSDVLLWAKGLAFGLDLDVNIDEPDVSPIAVQGPKSDDLMEKVFGSVVREIGFFKFKWLDFQGHPFVVARSGYSKQGGFEIYMDQWSLGEPLWDALWEAGQEYNVAPGCPNLIERIEGGLFSYGNEMTREHNPLECGLEQYCQLDGSLEFIGLSALQKASKDGITRQLRGIVFDGERCPSCATPWPLSVDDEYVGQITSAIWSPRLNNNIGLAMVDCDYWQQGQTVLVHSEDGKFRKGLVKTLPMQD